MVGFKTANSTYYIDQINRTITGGIFKDNKYRYLEIQALIGRNGLVKLENGRVIRTGIIKRYI